MAHFRAAEPPNYVLASLRSIQANSLEQLVFERPLVSYVDSPDAFFGEMDILIADGSRHVFGRLKRVYFTPFIPSCLSPYVDHRVALKSWLPRLDQLGLLEIQNYKEVEARFS